MLCLNFFNLSTSGLNTEVRNIFKKKQVELDTHTKMIFQDDLIILKGHG